MECLGQSAENRTKECHRFWLRLRRTVSDSNFKQSSISFKENKPDGFDPVLLLRSKENMKNSTVFGRLKDSYVYHR